MITETDIYNADLKLDQYLDNARIDTSINITCPPVILYVKETGFTAVNYRRVFTLGNFSCITGRYKTMKTTLLAMITAAIIKGKDKSDTFSGELPFGKKNIVYFDTEQGDYDAYNTICKIEKLSEKSDNFSGYSLREYEPRQRCEIVEYYFKLYGKMTALCIIDGIADLSTTINDEQEATKLTSMLLRLTKQYNCHIATIIHQNKGDNYATGHIGTSIMKKSEIIISVTKLKHNKKISEIACDYSRGVDFESFYIRYGADDLPEIFKDKNLNNDPF